MPRKADQQKKTARGRAKLEKSVKKKQPWEDSSGDDEPLYVHYLDVSESENETEDEDGSKLKKGLLDESVDLSEEDTTVHADDSMMTSLNDSVSVKEEKYKQKKSDLGMKAKAFKEIGLEPEEMDDENESASEVSSVSTFKSGYLEIPKDKRLVWLEEDKDIPSLTLPESSDDLCLKPSKLLLDCVEIYEICRRFCHVIRLSPFLIEDLCAALICTNEQSALLDELHVSLLKSLLKDDDAKQTVFASHDTRDFVNISFHFLDFMTYGEVLRRYVESDERFGSEIRDALSRECNYPFVEVDRRITVVKWLCNQFLTTVSAKTELAFDGTLVHDDHCRDCGKTGDLLCCDACTAVYHLACLEPPLSETPENRWLCPVCSFLQLPGGPEGLTEMEKTVRLIRHGSLGFDRHGRHYWFLARRIFIEDETNKAVWYYSTVTQFRQLLECLDAEDLEHDLCESLCQMASTILSDFDITEALTDDSKVSERSWLEWDSAKRSSRPLANKKVDFSDESSKNTKWSNLLKAVDKVLPESCPVLNKFSDDEEKPNTPPLTPVSDNDDFRPVIQRTVETSNNHDISAIEPDKFFKLGVDREFTKYVNHYSSNTLAKSPYLRAEERHRDRYICNRFGLDEEYEYKWPNDASNCDENKCLKYIRHCMNTLSGRLPSGLMHPLWPIDAVTSWKKQFGLSSDVKCLSLLIRTFESNIKPVVFNEIWKHSLGLTRFHRQTVEDKEKRQETDRLKRKNQITLSERLTASDPMDENTSVIWVKYTLFEGPPKHEIWKLKDEHYRINGFEKLGGWLWVRRGRTIKHTFYRNHGLLAGAAYESRDGPTINRMLSDLRNGSLSIDESVENDEQFVDVKQNENVPLCSNLPVKVNEFSTEPEVDRRLAAAKLKLKDHLDVVDVTSALRLHSLYFKVAHGSKFLDSLLSARLKQCESKHSLNDSSEDGENSFNECYSPTCRFATDEDDEDRSSCCYSYECRLRGSRRRTSDTKSKHTLIRPLLTKVDLDAISDKNTNTNNIFEGDKILKRPELNLFRMKRDGKLNVLILQKHVVRRLARKKLRNVEIEVEGFNSASKANLVFWPYPCIRPYFSTCWRFQMAKAESLHSVALLLRILFSSIRWSDVMKNVGVDAYRRRMESGTETRELIKHKSLLPYGLTANYFVRILNVPNDQNRIKDDLAYESSDEEYDPTPWKLRERRKDKERRLKLEQQKQNKPIAYYKWLKEEDLIMWEVKNYWATYEKRLKAKQLEESRPALPTPKSNGGGAPPILGKAQTTASSPSMIRQTGPNNFSLSLPASGSTFVQRHLLNNIRPSISRTPFLTKPNIVGVNINPASAPTSVRQTRYVISTPSSGHTYATPTSSANQIRFASTGGGGIHTARLISCNKNISPSGAAPQVLIFKSQNGEQKVLRIGKAGEAPPGGVVNRILSAGMSLSSSPSSSRGGVGEFSVKISPKVQPSSSASSMSYFVDSDHNFVRKYDLAKDDFGPAKYRTTPNVFDNSGGGASSSATPSLLAVDNDDDAFNSFRSKNFDQSDDDDDADGLPRLSPIFQSGNVRRPIKLASTLASSPTLTLVAQLTANDGATRRRGANRGRPRGAGACSTRAGRGRPSAARKTSLTRVYDDDPDYDPEYDDTCERRYTKIARLDGSELSDTYEDGFNSRRQEQNVRAEGVERRRRLAGYVRSATVERNQKERMEQERLERLSSTILEPNRQARVKQELFEKYRSRVDRLEQEQLEKLRFTECKSVLKSLVDRVCDMEKYEQIREKKMGAQEMRKVYWKRYRVKQKIRQQYEDQVASRLSRWKKEIVKRRQIMETEMNAIAQKELDNGCLEALKMARDMTSSKSKKRTYLTGGKRKAYDFTKEPKLSKKYMKLIGGGGVRFKTTTPSSSVGFPKKRGRPSLVKTSTQFADNAAAEDLLSDKNDEDTSSAVKVDGTAPDTSCICKRPYDATKFYVGCDLCSRYFHGKCVGVTAQISKRINTWYCPDCQRERQNAKQELYCICRTPYDESQFYISCDCCDQWFHGKCVGIESDEGEEIPAFICQECSRSQNGTIQPMIKPLTPNDVERVEGVLNLLERHKMSWPFRNAVDFNKHPKYRQIVQDPMDLSFVKRKLRDLHYRFLAEFTSDVSLIFNNARKYFSPDSPEFQCATVLDRYFSDRLHELKQEMIKELKNY